MDTITKLETMYPTGMTSLLVFVAITIAIAIIAHIHYSKLMKKEIDKMYTDLRAKRAKAESEGDSKNG